MCNYGLLLFVILIMWAYPSIYFYPYVALPHNVPKTQQPLLPVAAL